jgi:hypothetical protein
MLRIRESDQGEIAFWEREWDRDGETLSSEYKVQTTEFGGGSGRLVCSK